jgi:hypothetical protein
MRGSESPHLPHEWRTESRHRAPLSTDPDDLHSYRGCNGSVKRRSPPAAIDVVACGILSGVSRRTRRHPGSDPVAEAQEEANWSGFTRHIRATSQGRWLFPHRRDPGILETRATSGKTVVIALVLCALGLGVAIAILLTLLQYLFGSG